MCLPKPRQSNMPKPKDRWVFDNQLINVRIVFLSLALLHLLVTALVTLSIDTTVDDDPKIRAYYHVRWKLLTCWFNLITLAYLPARLYVDWRTRGGEGSRSHVRTLHHATDVVMTSVVMPTTVFADVMFWTLFLTDPALMAPMLLFNYLPRWSQHSLHSVSLVFVAIDLLLTPRRRPSSMKNRLALMTAFVLIYTLVVYYSLSRGEIVYAFLEDMNLFQLAMMVPFSVLFFYVIFKIQWFAIDILWKKKVYVECVTIKHK